ncbi:MAG: SDR family oxidoreductase [Burkholderiaceae bacterium]
MAHDLGDRQDLVTAGTSGIGLAIARAFARAGAQVVGAGVAGSMPVAESGPRFETLDVTDATQVGAVVGGMDRLDVPVSAADVIRRGDEHDPNVFARVVDISLNGAMRVATAARPLLAASRGCVVNMASMLSFFEGGLVPACSASKGGIAQLTKSLAIAWAPHGVRVNALAPSWIATPLTQALQDDPARSAAVLARTPLGRWGTPDDVAGPVLFLCSPAVAFATGPTNGSGCRSTTTSGSGRCVSSRPAAGSSVCGCGAPACCRATITCNR